MQSDVLSLVVNPEKFETLAEFIAHAEATPGKVGIGGPHAASVDRMAFLGLNDATGLDLAFIPDDNEGSASTNLMSGSSDGMFNEIGAIQGYWTRAGRSRSRRWRRTGSKPVPTCRRRW